MKNNKTITLSSEDYPKLRLLAASLASRKPGGAQALLEELDRAVVLEARALPPTVVKLGSRFEIQDLDTGETEAYTVNMPDRADPEQNVISVLAPIGTAVLGYSEDDKIEWKTPGGVRRLKITKVQQPVLA